LDPPPDEAELAVVVADDWQARGLGTKMLIHILDVMIKRKIKRVHGDVFLENRKMLQLMHQSGFAQIKDDAFGVRHFKLKLQ
jgi:acetyltransferase